MSTILTTNLIIRVDSSVKEEQRTAAQQAHRCIANIVEMLVGETRAVKRGSHTK